MTEMIYGLPGASDPDQLAKMDAVEHIATHIAANAAGVPGDSFDAEFFRRRVVEAAYENPGLDERMRARAASYNAQKSGRLRRRPCEVCGSNDVEGHHDDYSRPLDVRWLCRKHHDEWHSNYQPKFCPISNRDRLGEHYRKLFPDGMSPCYWAEYDYFEHKLFEDEFLWLANPTPAPVALICELPPKR